MTVLTYCNCYIMYFQYFVLERSRDKYTVTLHRVICQFICMSRRDYIPVSIIYGEMIS